MKPLKAGDRVQLTKMGIEQGLANYGYKTQQFGILKKVRKDGFLLVLRDDRKVANVYHSQYWEKAKAAELLAAGLEP
jgi:hypothetical protein